MDGLSENDGSCEAGKPKDIDVSPSLSPLPSIPTMACLAEGPRPVQESSGSSVPGSRMWSQPSSPLSSLTDDNGGGDDEEQHFPFPSATPPTTGTTAAQSLLHLSPQVVLLVAKEMFSELDYSLGLAECTIEILQERRAAAVAGVSSTSDAEDVLDQEFYVTLLQNALDVGLRFRARMFERLRMVRGIVSVELVLLFRVLVVADQLMDILGDVLGPRLVADLRDDSSGGGEDGGRSDDDGGSEVDNSLAAEH